MCSAPYRANHRVRKRRALIGSGMCRVGRWASTCGATEPVRGAGLSSRVLVAWGRASLSWPREARHCQAFQSGINPWHCLFRLSAPPQGVAIASGGLAKVPGTRSRQRAVRTQQLACLTVSRDGDRASPISLSREPEKPQGRNGAACAIEPRAPTSYRTSLSYLPEASAASATSFSSSSLLRPAPARRLARTRRRASE